MTMFGVEQTNQRRRGRVARLRDGALVLCILATGCDAKTSSFFAPPLGSDGLVPAGLTGTVSIDGVGAGLVRVTVDPLGRTTNTDSEGTYTFIPLPPGSYRVRISNLPPGTFCPETEKDVVAEGGSFTAVDFECVTGGEVAGILFVDGTPLDSIPITVFGPVIQSTVTDSLGEYSFEDLPPGEYVVTPGPLPGGTVCIPPTATVTVTGGDTITPTFTCTRLGDVTGTILVDGTPFAGVTVILTWADGSQTAVTDASGVFTFTDVLAGEVTLTLSGVDGDVLCTPPFVRITVIAGDDVDVDFRCAAGSADASWLPRDP